MEGHKCLIISPRPTDWVKGVNSKIEFRAVTGGDWSEYMPDFDLQKINGFETDSCVPFSEVQSIELQLNSMLKSGVLPDSTVAFLKANGYVEATGFVHLSERYIAKLDGTTQVEGTDAVSPWDAMRKYGLLPFSDWPFNETITNWAEYDADIPPQLISKAKQFLNYFTIQYHWIIAGATSGTDESAVMSALKQAPVCAGGPACMPWNQEQPPVCDSILPQHMTTIYRADPNFTYRLDHYIPFLKRFPWEYNTPYMIQGVLTALPPANPPQLPDAPDIPEIQTWLSQISAWLQSLLGKLKVGNNH